MNHPTPGSWASLATILRGAVLLAIVGPAAALSEDGNNNPASRTDGRPDFSGTYDTATLTPLVRPSHFGNRLALTNEEAAEIAEHWRANFAKDQQPSDPNREAPPEGGVGIYAPEFTGAAGKVGGYNAFFVDIGENTFSLNGRHRTSIITDPPDGRYPPLSEAGKARRAKAAAGRHENTGTAWWIDMKVGPYDDPELRPLAERCILSRNRSGPPTLPAMYNNLKTIVQTEDHVMILAEQMHDARIIRLNAEPGSADLPRWMGDSVGHWEGDTLVVETTNFLESTGDTSTTQVKRVTERFSRIEGGALLYQFTVDDPSFAEPWSGEYPWPATNSKLYEYACHEGNYSFGGILRGARLLEDEAQNKIKD